jgi:myo-inositol 2-dehydrogenase/D-chiro-inositol 1-dehydrogenase/scyllo-inositol 2-dehydrogenase (NAD+)
MRKIKLGIIGLGYIGQLHLRNGFRLSNAQVSAVSDVSRKALARARKLGVKTLFSNYEEMLEDPQIDAVIIALPTHLHLQCAKKAAEAKKHIFLEKPMARNMEEAKEIVRAARDNEVKLMMGYHLRFNTGFSGLREKIRQRTIGDVEIAYATFISSGPFFHRDEGYSPVPVPEWWFDRELTGGGALIDLGSHMINLLRWYFGEISDIKANFGHRFSMDVEDSAVCLVRFHTGTRAIINVGWFCQGYQLKVDLLGSVGCESAQHAPANPLSTVAQLLTTGTSKFYHSHQSELQYFVNCLIKDIPPSPSGQDGFKDLEAITRAYENEIQLR